MSKTKHKDTDYLFLTSMLRARESRMLSTDKMERMLDAPGFDEAAKQLTECGYPDMSGMAAAQIEQTLAEYRAGIFAELTRMSPEKALVDLFRIKYDYHNAKVLVKSEGAGISGDHILSKAGRIDPETLKDEFQAEVPSSLPKALADAMVSAKSVLARTSNPQLADIELDRAYFSEMTDMATEIGDSFSAGYVKVLIDSANLKTAVRVARMGRDQDFLKTALIPGGDVSVDRFVSVFAAGAGLSSLFTFTNLEKAGELSSAAIDGGSMTEFELACDNAVTAYLSASILKSFGEAPVLAYLAALENELTAVRMILTGKLSGIDPKLIRERLRDCYA